MNSKHYTVASFFAIALAALTFGCAGEIEQEGSSTQLDNGTPGLQWCTNATQGQSKLCPAGYTIKVYGADTTTAASVLRAKYFWTYAGAPPMTILQYPDISRPDPSHELEECTFSVYNVPEESQPGLLGWAEWFPGGASGTFSCRIQVSAHQEGTLVKSGFDKDAVMAHELGHCLGIGHVNDSNDVMYVGGIAWDSKFDYSSASYWDGAELQKRYGGVCQ